MHLMRFHFLIRNLDFLSFLRYWRTHWNLAHALPLTLNWNAIRSTISRSRSESEEIAFVEFFFRFTFLLFSVSLRAAVYDAFRKPSTAMRATFLPFLIANKIESSQRSFPFFACFKNFTFARITLHRDRDATMLSIKLWLSRNEYFIVIKHTKNLNVRVRKTLAALSKKHKFYTKIRFRIESSPTRVKAKNLIYGILQASSNLHKCIITKNRSFTHNYCETVWTSSERWAERAAMMNLGRHDLDLVIGKATQQASG